jgi:hypothetical protein
MNRRELFCLATLPVALVVSPFLRVVETVVESVYPPRRGVTEYEWRDGSLWMSVGEEFTNKKWWLVC